MNTKYLRHLRPREAARLTELERLGAVRPEADRVLQELVDDAREVFGTELCMVNIVTSDVQYFRAWSGKLPHELAAARRGPRGRSMCRHVVETEEPLVVEDFLATERFKDQHFRARYGIRFYAGTPLITANGHAIGSLCLLDMRPHGFDERDITTLRVFARAVVGRLETLAAAAREKAAKEDERRYRRNVFELANDAIMIHDPESGLIMDANRRACEMYGVPQGKLSGKNVAELSLEPEVAEGHLRDLLRQGSHRGFETVHRRADGAPIDVSINSSLTEYGGQRAVLSISRDTTGRKRAEEKIRKSEARNNAILNASPDSMFIYSRDGEYLDIQANEAGKLYLPHDSLIGRRLGDVLPPEVAQPLLREISYALDTQETRIQEYRLEVPDGVLDFEAYLVAAGPNEVLCVARDVTGRKRTEGRLREAEEKYRTLIEQAPAIVYVDTLEGPGHRGYTSPRAETLLGYPMEAWGADPLFWTKKVHPEDRERVVAENERANALAEPLVLDYRMVCRDGRVVWLRDHSVVLRDGGGRPWRRQGIMLDVSEHKEAEKKLREAEERYRVLVEQIPAVTYVDRVTDGPDEPLYTSPQIEDLLGYTQEEWLEGHLWSERLHPEDRERILAADERFERGGEPFSEEYRLFAKDGRVVWVREEAALVRGDGAEPLYWQGVFLDITGRKEADGRLRESEERFRSLVQNASDVVLIVEASGILRYASPALEQVLGYRPEDVVGTDNFTPVHPDDLSRVRDLIADAVKDPGSTLVTELRLRHADGSWRHVESRCTSLLDDPAVGGIVINSRDVTERKAIEEALRQSEVRFRTIFERSAIGISIADLDRKLLETNPAYQGMLGYSGEELLGKPIAEISHPEDVPEDRELHEALLAGDVDSYRREKRYVRKDGKVIWVRPTISAVRDARGEPQFLVGMVEDVTERKGWERKLREAEEKYRTLVEQIPAVIYVREATGSKALTYISPQMETMLGYSPEACVSDPDQWRKILHPDDKQRVLAEDKRTDETGEPFRIEYRQFANDGSVVWVQDDAVLVRDEEGNPSYWLGVKTDIMERKRAEAALRESEERLQRLADAAFEGIIIHDGGVVLEANEAYAAMHGYEISEVVGRSTLEWVAPEYRALVRQHVFSGYEEPYESVELKKDGTRIDVEVRGKALFYRGRTVRVTAVRDITERKRAEAALRESEELYRRQAKQLELLHQVRTELAQEMAPPAVFRTVVEAIARAYGYTQVSAYRLRGETLILQHQVGYEQVLTRIPIQRGIMGRVVRTRQPALLGNVRSDPAFLGAIEGITSEVCVPLLDEGEVVGTLNVESTDGVDLTEDDLRLMLALAEHVNVALSRARLHARVRDSEKRFRSLIQNASDVITLLEADGTVRYQSLSVTRVLGYQPDELIGKNVFEYVHPEDVERVLGTFAEGVENPELRPVAQCRFRHKDGSWRHLESIGSNLLDDPGVGTFVVNSRDITERMRAQEALGESEKRYRAVVEQSAEAIWLFDPDTKQVLEANAAFQEMLGYGAEELRRMTNYDFVAHSREDVDRAVMRKLRGEENPRTERKYRRKDGTLLDVEVGGTVISYGGKKVVCSVARDITERKQVEEEMKEANRRLGELATLRADFTAMVAHELDTPLAVIRGYADVLATGELETDAWKRALSRIQAETEILNALVEDVRVAASAERKDFAVNPRRVPVAELLDDAVHFVATLPGDHPFVLDGAADDKWPNGVRAGYADPFIFKGAADGQNVWADRYRIDQVIRNLLANAVKYSPEGALIELRVLPSQTPGRVRMEVIDHGPGIHPDDVERIFEKFGRGRDPEGRQVAGLGLGLYLSRRILRAHGSDLTVDATPGGGSVFGFDLEAADE